MEHAIPLDVAVRLWLETAPAGARTRVLEQVLEVLEQKDEAYTLMRSLLVALEGNVVWMPDHPELQRLRRLVGLED